MKRIPKYIQVTAKYFAVTLFMLLCGGKSYAQDEVTLHIGDVPPALKYSKWLRGVPILKFDENHVYVLEFWATWCGPCIGSMPHLSDLAEKYKGKATFVGVNVWEKTGDKPHETSLPQVTRFVEASKDRMRYDVAADNNAQDMAKGWLSAAGISGIPTTFVIQKGKIAWIGHPMKLDSIMDPMIAGTFDIAANKKVYEEKERSQRKEVNGFNRYGKELKQATDAKQFSTALAIIDRTAEDFPKYKFMFDINKFSVLLDSNENVGMDYANQLLKMNPKAGLSITMDIAAKNNLSKSTYLFAVDLLLKMSPTSSAIMDKAAELQSKAGEHLQAVVSQGKAIELAKTEVNDPKYAGWVFDYTITDYQKKLDTYKKTTAGPDQGKL